jgi:hypothetical protein
MNNDSGQIKRRAGEGGLDSVQHPDALFARGVGYVDPPRPVGSDPVYAPCLVVLNDLS